MMVAQGKAQGAHAATVAASSGFEKICLCETKSQHETVTTNAQTVVTDSTQPWNEAHHMKCALDGNPKYACVVPKLAITIQPLIADATDADCTPPAPPSVSLGHTGTHFRLVSLGQKYWCMRHIDFLNADGTIISLAGASYDASSRYPHHSNAPNHAFADETYEKGSPFCSTEKPTSLEKEANQRWLSIQFPSAITVATINMGHYGMEVYKGRLTFPDAFKWESSSDGTTWTQFGDTQTTEMVSTHILPAYPWFDGQYTFDCGIHLPPPPPMTGVDNTAANLRGHWDAMNSASLTKDTSGNVEVWTDLSTGGFNLATTADQISLRPKLVLDGINGHAAVDFSGSNYLASSIKHPTKGARYRPFTWIAVVQSDDGGGNQNIFTTFDAHKIGEPTRYMPAWMATDRQMGFSFTPTNAYSGGTCTDANRMVIISYRYNGTSLNAWSVDSDGTGLGVNQIDNMTPTPKHALWYKGGFLKPHTVGYGDFGYVVLGRSQQGAPKGFNGKIGEVIAYTTALSESDLTTIVNGLMTKWS
jgi:hypothetical protein